MTETMNITTRSGLAFTTDVDGPIGGPLVLMLHGFPESRHSWRAALRAAGAAIAATDAVIAGEVSNAFCSVRPPGHHATPSASMGFCLFNNVAIAARHAMDVHGLSRIAIVDFDVHGCHGLSPRWNANPQNVVLAWKEVSTRAAKPHMIMII